jgi:diguanylate cyclase (GGDEF)-like protein/PAS domain S-box-containing protein
MPSPTAAAEAPVLAGDATQRALRISESRYRRLFEAAQDGILLLNADTAQIEDVNPYLIHMLGYSHAEFLGKKLWEVGPFADKAQSQEMFAALQAHGYVRYDDLPLKAKNGAIVPVEFVSNAYDCEGIRVIQCNIRNISERHADRASILRYTQLYATLSQCNKAIVHSSSEAELLQTICRVAVQSGGMKMAWVGLINSETQLLQAQASFGDETGYLSGLSLPVHGHSPGGQGPVLRAIQERQPVWCLDFLNEASTPEWHARARAAGLAASASLPLVKAGLVVGTFTLYAQERGAFGTHTRELLVEMADELNFALDRFVHLSESKKAQERITYLNRVYAMLSGINTLIVRTDNREELFKEACRIAVDGGFRMALIAMADPRSQKLAPVASQGKDEALLAAIARILASDTSAAQTMSARALREKQVVVSNHSQHDPQVLFGDHYSASGIHSIAVFPLLVDDVAVGVLALYATEAEFFHGEELKLLTELAGDVAFAIDHIQKQERLNYFAYYDALTGLANQSLFLERVAQAARSGQSAGHKVAIALIDLERFRNINDSLGRGAGDELLRKLAQWMTRYAGDASLLARLGADHFAVLMPVVQHGKAVETVLAAMMKSLLEHPFRLNDAIFRVAAKVGVAIYPDDGTDTDTLFRNAEAALKKAKSSNQRYLFYTQSMHEMVAGKLTLENQLRLALRRGEFVLHYQPKVNLLSGKLCGAEALIRWNKPHEGLVAPGLFITVLEEIGLIQEVGRWAMGQANLDYRRWHAAGLEPVRIAVNVSALQLRNQTFLDEVRQLLESHDRVAAGLELEITESLIMEDVKHSIINLAHALKLKVVAEGVETEEQARLLRLLNCDEMQGFLFSKAVTADQFEARFLVRTAP